ncbi:ExbD/TolR family protein [Verrucomicrobiota bacterium sgz303538]
MKLSSPIPPRKARIEIIPLIDIMFFLLACFMLVSLSMTQMRGMKVTLPTATSSTPENKSDFHAITIDALGNLYLEKDAMDRSQLMEQVKALSIANPEARFYIRADENATHGEVVRLLDEIKRVGIQKVAFEIKAQSIAAPTAVPATAPAQDPAAPVSEPPTQQLTAPAAGNP